MTPLNGHKSFKRPQLDLEWARISRLILMVEVMRTGGSFPESFEDEIEALCLEIKKQRTEDSWGFLENMLGPEEMKNIVALDLDILSVVLAPDLMPALAPRMNALQPQVKSPYPTIALLQELLLLDKVLDMDKLMQRLSPVAPLMAKGLLCVETEGDYQFVRPLPSTVSAFTGRSQHLGPPPGAHVVKDRAMLSDLVLPAQTKELLSQFIVWIKNQDTVFSKWGGRRIGGPLALFSGPSGVGKSFAATAIAGELGWPLFALDLGRVMSKYIGETEANLNRLLDALDGRPAVLQVDEADALLGKRGEISDARDRYANLEVSHLLSRVERHHGPIILTTNLRANLDSAFMRRFQFVVDFPIPDTGARTTLWGKLLPPNGPLAGEVNLEALGASAKISGGAIHNTAISAAMLAAGEKKPIANRHIAKALWQELSKEGRQVRLSEVGHLGAYLKGGAG